MIWNNQNVLKFIEAYKEKDVLWDPSHRNYYNRNLKQEAWEELSVEMECNVNKLKKKMDYLLAALRREKSKINKTATAGKGADEVYQSTWFPFKYMQFLMNRNRTRPKIHTEEQDHASKQYTSDNVEKGQIDQDYESQDELPSSIESTEFKEQGPHNEATNPSESVFKSPKQKKRRSDAPQDPMLQTSFDLLKSSASTVNAAATASFPPVTGLDQYQLYANYLAGKFRGYSKHTFITVEHQINNILYNADCGQYEYQSGYCAQASSSYSVAETRSSRMSEASTSSYRADNPAPSMVKNQVQQMINSPASEVNYSPEVQVDDTCIDSKDSLRDLMHKVQYS